MRRRSLNRSKSKFETPLAPSANRDSSPEDAASGNFSREREQLDNALDQPPQTGRIQLQPGLLDRISFLQFTQEDDVEGIEQPEWRRYVCDRLRHFTISHR
jgi:hypothetical protein